MKHKILNFDSGKPILRINTEIGTGENQISSAKFESALDLISDLGYSNLLITINSSGGSLFEAMSIFSAIQDSDLYIETQVTGIAASSAGLISQAGKKRTIKDFALFHAHAPFYDADNQEDGAEKALNISKDSVAIMLSSKSKISKDKIMKMLDSETYLSAKEAYKMGFFDEVINTNHNVKIPVNSSAKKIVEIFNEANKFYKKRDMKKITEVLNLNPEASEDAILKAVNQLVNNISDLEKLKIENQELKIKLDSFSKVSAETLIQNYVDKKVIKEEAKEYWVKNAKNDIDGTKTLLDSFLVTENQLVSPVSKNIANVVNQTGTQEAKKGYNDYSETELKELERTNPDLLNKLISDYIK